MTVAEYVKSFERIRLSKAIKEFYGEELMRCVDLEGGSIEINTTTMQYDFKNISSALSKRLSDFKDIKLKKRSSANT